jgi:hypothetical protein
MRPRNAVTVLDTTVLPFFSRRLTAP